MANKANNAADFFAQVKRIEGGCWEWQGSLWATGYGRFHFQDKSMKAHRMSWFFARGEIPEQCLLHRCDNRLCVNPDHLFVGTRTDNNADKVAKGRQAKGEALNTAKVTTHDVAAIRAACSSSKEIAEQYGLSWGHINKIRGGRVWTHV